MKNPSINVLSPAAYRRRATAFSATVVLVVAACLFMGFDPYLLITDLHYVVDLFKSMSPPNFDLLWADKTIGLSVLETMSMAFLGTLFGGGIAVLTAFLSAENTMPVRLVRIVTRTLLSLARVIPPLFIILVFVAAVGLGPFAGMLALCLTTIGTFGQLFSEIIENTEPAPADAVYSVGATRWQVIRYVILPQVTPSFIANLFYAFDLNIRVAIGLGIFGGGGIGFQLFQAMRVLHYRDALALILLTMVLIIASEKISDGLRSRFLIVTLAR
ncbi:MAG TPA: phosphonate ABC transporter, permease protein PhnE [Puia sp.]|nr:phosphonate ABC transporter, permease protein PhnE [Puia sp.]